MYRYDTFLKVFKFRRQLSCAGVLSQMVEYASNREKWLIILLVIIVVAGIALSVVIYGPHWIKGISAFI
jgi:hypothetical protein